MTQHTLHKFSEVHEALCHPALRQSLYDAGEVIMRDVLLTLHGEVHKKRRHLELRLFRRNFAHHYETEVFPATVDRALQPLVVKRHADLVDFGYRVTMNLTADFAGIDRMHDNQQETDSLLAIVKTFSEGATLVHSERSFETVVTEVREAQAKFEQEFLRPSWQRRQTLVTAWRAGDIDETELPRDVLTVLLQNQETAELTDDVIGREIAFYLQAGSHSTANSMVHAVHEIFNWAQNPHALLDDPLLLQKCVHESLRLHPASPVAWRTPVEPINFKTGLHASSDDLIILDLQAANRDKSVFGDDADRFNPHRIINHPKTELYGLTFGTGVHMCTGRDLDGGVASRADTQAETHQYGIVCLLIKRLLEHNMQAHPTQAPEQDQQSKRTNWAVYPVLLDEASGA